MMPRFFQASSPLIGTARASAKLTAASHRQQIFHLWKYLGVAQTYSELHRQFRACYSQVPYKRRLPWVKPENSVPDGLSKAEKTVADENARLEKMIDECKTMVDEEMKRGIKHHAIAYGVMMVGFGGILALMIHFA